MSCFWPGRVIVASTAGTLEAILGLFREYTDQRTEVAYSVEEILRHYHFHEPLELMLKAGVALPFAARVPEGQEVAWAERFARVPSVIYSTPDFFVRPTASALTLDQPQIDEALDSISCLDDDPDYGAGVRIAILDTGIERTFLSPACKLTGQYDSEIRKHGPDAVAFEDSVGHGTLVGHIVNRIAPRAELLSVRVMNSVGTMGGFLAGIFLAEAEFKPTIFNLSLSVSCDQELCPVCQTARSQSVNVNQLKFLLDNATRTRTVEELPLYVAAAGNGRKSISVPAAFSKVIAVGAYDAKTGTEAEYSRYSSVPPDRFILAPGGSRGSAAAFGQRTREGRWDTGGWLFGTSFSTAFVTGVLARYLGLPRNRVAARDPYLFALSCLRTSANTGWPGYEPSKHGLGIVNWNEDFEGELAPNAPAANTEQLQIFVVLDTTASMTHVRERVSTHIESLGTSNIKDAVFRLVLYGDHHDPYTVYVHRVSESLKEIIDGVRSAPVTDGSDVPEALEDAIHFVNEQINSMKLRRVHVVVFTDAGPHIPEECPFGFDFAEEVRQLKASGAKFEIVDCKGAMVNGAPQAFDLADISTLDRHAWTT
jgi:subtilisin family serine protease